MAYDSGLYERLDNLLDDYPELTEKKMFGGICWLHRGNLCFGIYKDFLIIRVGDETAQKLFKDDAFKTYIKAFDITGKTMKGWLMVNAEGYEEDKQLKYYTDLAFTFVKTLPSKKDY